MQGFVQRGVAHYVVSEHKTGDLIKFYGVAGTSFFIGIRQNVIMAFQNSDLRSIMMNIADLLLMKWLFRNR